MNRSIWRTFLPALAAVVLACTSVAPPVASQVPTAVVIRPTPAPTSAPTSAPSATPGASPTLAPTPVQTPTPTPTLAPSPSPTPSLKPTETPATTLATRLTRQLRDVLNQKRSSLRIPGVSASVIFPDGSQWSNASGQSKISPSTLASAFTPFVVGSITKTFVAAAVMDMAEDGLLSIDDPLSTWMPSYPRADQMTLRHLLSHTSGVFNYFEHPTYNKRVFSTNKGKAWTPQEILDNFVSAPYFAPGAGYHYSNTNFVLLGMVIEQVSGQSLGDVFRTRLLTPLGLTGTYFQGDAAPPTTAAHGYLLKKGVFKSVSDATDYRPTISAATVAWAAGGMVSSARDIARWCDALYGGHLLEPDSVSQMIDFTYYPATNEAYGLGTRSRTFSGKRMFGHTGSLRGYVASMWYYPDLDLTVVVLTNRGRIDTNPIADALAAVALPDSQAAVDQR